MDEWKQVELADLCTRVTSGGTPARSHPEYYAMQAHGHPWVKSSELRDRYIGATEEQISDLGLQNSAAKLLPPETVLVAMYGATAGRVGLLKIEAALNQAICALVPDRDRVDPVFLFHTLRSQHEALSGKAAGAAQQNLNAGIVKAFPLRVPNVVTQSRIAAVLSAFDELIEINERRIQLLEDRARSLYREWFVHFRFPGHEDVEFVDSELGPIPKDWATSSAAEIFHINPRGSSSQDDYRKVTMGDVSVRASHVLPSKLTKRASGSRFRRGDVLLARITPCLENGKTALVLFPKTDEMAVGSTEFIVLRGIDVGPGFVYCAARSSELRDHAIKSMSGASGRQRVPTDAFRSLRIVKPSGEVAELFEDVAMPMLESVFQHRLQSEQLAATRDLLLPRLVSGKLDISDLDLGVLTPAETE